MLRSRLPGGYTLKDFAIDWQEQVVRCPQGHQSQSWEVFKSGKSAGSVRVLFAREICATCPVRTQCTRARQQGRQLSLPPPEQAEWLATNRQVQNDEAYRHRYGLRSGVEACISQAVHLQQVGCAVALNLIRLDAWWQRRPRGKLRRGRFGRLMAA